MSRHDLLVLAGLSSIVVGVALVHPALAFIAAGVFAVIVAVADAPSPKSEGDA